LESHQTASTESFKFPPVSIIVVNYNGHRWLKLFIHTLVNSSYPDFEIIVVDNGSTDESIEFLQKHFDQIKIIHLSENKGFGQAVNIGASQARGTILAFVNNDMEFPSEWLKEAILELYSEDKVGAVQCKILSYNSRQIIDSVGLSVDHYNLSLAIGNQEIDEGQYDSLKELGACSGGAMIIPKSLFLQIGCFDPVYFMYYEDVDLNWRIKFAGYKIKPASSSKVYHIGSGSSKITLGGIYNPSPFFAFETTKNYIYCWLKNSKTRTIICYWPVVVFVVLSLSLFALLGRKLRAFLAYYKGIFWTLKHINLIRKKRNEIKKVKKGSSDSLLFAEGIISDSSNLPRRFRRAFFVGKDMIASKNMN
jgi:GT2 family glycosyltransferase